MRKGAEGQPKQYDLVLIHGQGYSPLGDRPNVRGRYEMSALQHLLRNGVTVDAVAFDGAALFGNETPLGQVDASELSRRLTTQGNEIPIFVGTEALTSGHELAFAKRTAEQHGYTKILDITTALHKPRVKTLVSQTFPRQENGLKRVFDLLRFQTSNKPHTDGQREITVMSAEEILQNVPNHPTRKKWTIQNILRSENDPRKIWRFAFYEIAGHGIALAPGGQRLLNTISKRFRPNPNTK